VFRALFEILIDPINHHSLCLTHPTMKRNLFDFGFASGSAGSSSSSSGGAVHARSANLGAFNYRGTAFGSSTLTSAFASSSSDTSPSASSVKKAKTEEIWKRVADINLNFLPDGCDPNRYHVSDLGRAKSIINGKTNYLSGSINKHDGYVQIGFSASSQKNNKLHRVVCWAFNGEPPEVLGHCLCLSSVPRVCLMLDLSCSHHLIIAALTTGVPG
jgi:NUMOD4 motif